MKSYILTTILLFFSFFSIAQESTKAPSADVLQKENQPSILLVPFDPVLFQCDISKEIAVKEKLTFEQILKEVRWQLDFTIGNFLKSDYHVLASLREKSEDIQKDLEYLFSSISFSYEKVPSTKQPENKLHPTKREPKGKKTEIKNGQMVSSDISYERYMTTKIKDREMLHYFNKKYQPDIYLFITQVELKYDLKNPSAEIHGSFNRIAKVHFNFLNGAGEVVAGGIASAPFSSDNNLIVNISNEAFSEIVFQIKALVPSIGREDTLTPTSTNKKN